MNRDRFDCEFKGYNGECTKKATYFVTQIWNKSSGLQHLAVSEADDISAYLCFNHSSDFRINNFPHKYIG